MTRAQTRITIRLIGALIMAAGTIMALLTLLSVGEAGTSVVGKYVVAALFFVVGAFGLFGPMRVLEGLVDWWQARIG